MRSLLLWLFCITFTYCCFFCFALALIFFPLLCRSLDPWHTIFKTTSPFLSQSFSSFADYAAAMLHATTRKAIARSTYALQAASCACCTVFSRSWCLPPPLPPLPTRKSELFHTVLHVRRVSFKRTTSERFRRGERDHLAFSGRKQDCTWQAAYSDDQSPERTKIFIEPHTYSPSKNTILTGNHVVNCGGTVSDLIAQMVGDDSFTVKPRMGEYILLHKVKHLL